MSETVIPAPLSEGPTTPPRSTQQTPGASSVNGRKQMTEQIFCPAQTYPATQYEPAEYCSELVSDYGDLCPEHEEDDRADELYEAWLEAKHERETDPENYYTDFGD